MKAPQLYPVHEMFHSFQGEGVHAGRSAFFIRLYGCPVQCPWCDSAGTWHPKYVPPEVQRLTASAIVEAVVAGTRPEFVVITGGEPTIFPLWELVEAFRDIGLPVHLETSGAFEAKGSFDWITLSPKRWKLPLLTMLTRAHEFKFIIERPEDVAFYTGIVDGMTSGTPVPNIWLHPEWSHREDPVVLKAITEAVVQGSGLYRAGWQMHKPYRADQADNRTRPAVPLGGDETKGF